jgi:hypothetical protein
LFLLLSTSFLFLLLNDCVNGVAISKEFLVNLFVSELYMGIIFFLLIGHLLDSELVAEVPNEDDVSFVAINRYFMLTNSYKLVLFLLLHSITLRGRLGLDGYVVQFRLLSWLNGL